MGRRDQDMGSRRVSPGAKVGIFVVVLLLVGALAFGAWFAISKLTSGSDHPLIAGESFTPEAVETIYETETTAVLQDLEQKVQASNPSEEWKTNLENVQCDEQGLCLADAPKSIDGESSGGGPFAGLFQGDGFLGTGVGLGSVVGAAVVFCLLYLWINDSEIN